MPDLPPVQDPDVRDRGLRPSPFSVTDYRFLGVTGIAGEVLEESGQYDEWLPKFQPQSQPFFDDMACVSHSACYICSTLKKRKYGLDDDHADRFLAQMSGTKPWGNYLSNVVNAAKKFGICEEVVWPIPPHTTWTEYYAEPSWAAKRAAAEMPKNYLIRYEWVQENWRNGTVEPKTLMEALKYGPVQICVRAWGRTNDQGIHTRIAGETNHAVMLYGYEEGKYWKIFDSYLPAKKKLAWDYYIDSALKISLDKISMSKVLNENYLYQQVQGEGETNVHGGFALAIGQVLYVDDLSKILASWEVRNNGNTAGKTGTLTKAEWLAIPKKNLKGVDMPVDAVS